MSSGQTARSQFLGYFSNIKMASGDSGKVVKTGSVGKAKSANQEQIIAGFQELRNQQRAVASKLSELEMERKEHE